VLNTLLLPAGVLRLEAYCDSNWAGLDNLKAKSTSGSVVYFGGGPIDWSSKLQSTVATSSANAETVAAFDSSKNVFYYRQFLDELGYPQSSPTTLWEDNTACIAQSKNPIQSSKTKHMHIKYNYVRDLAEASEIKLEYICTEDQIADIFTKALPLRLFARFAPFLVTSTSKSKLRSTSISRSSAS
jgi:hypothetical protein